MALPQFFVLKSNYNNKYLRYINEDVEVHGLLQFSEDDDLSPFIKYEVVKAKCGNGLVHISCCYNNKYWARWSPSHWWISAGADEQEEDQSKWSCTLFEPIYLDADAKTIRFRHIQLRHYACLWRLGPPYGSCLFGGSSEVDQDQCDVCTIINWELISRKNMAFKGDILPKLIVLKANHNNKYLHYTINEDVRVQGFLQFSGEDILSPFGKYEVEMAKCGNGLVHIRCCYNNKYWVRSSRDHCWIVAKANEPDENATKWSCTLFEPVYVDTNAETVRFRHVQLECYACLSRASDPPYNSCLYAGSKEPDNNEQCDVCTITDWNLLLVLPKYIAFKGDNGKFLSVKEGYPYLHFASTDIADPKVWNEVFTNHDGSVRIKSNYLCKFWKLDPDSNGIWADADDSTTENFDTWFWPVKVDDKVIALQNLGNKNFCKRHTVETEMSSLSFRPNEEEENYLNAAVCAITSEAKLEVCDLAMSRNIDSVTFRPMDARIYGQTVIIIASEKVVNGDPTNPITVNLNLTKTVTRSRTWNASTSLKLGVETKIQTMVPSITNGVIKLSSEFNGLYQWGHTETESIKLGSDHKVIVPPKSAMKVSMLVTEGLCDVPFSYTQCDTLINGKRIRCRMDDGIFTGNSFFDSKFEARPENL